ncbi:MAG: ATP-dependent DNA ligase [Chloroflexota bacterium]|nr:ATP-dependent DNA ligase [Chloroflexota bacterium]
MQLPVMPPVEPMLAKLTPAIPDGEGWMYEPKWDGFRALVFRDGDEVYLQSRDLKPLDRYFPELRPQLAALSARRFVLDGEIVIATPQGALDFEALLLRIHPAASRVAMLAEQTPASFVAFDLVAHDDDDLRDRPFADRRSRLEAVMSGAPASVHLTPATTDRATATDWFHRFEGAGLDGVIGKRLDDPYRPGQREMLKIKHLRTADCVVPGFRWHKNGPGTMVGSLLLGLWNAHGHLQHVGVTSSFSNDERRRLVAFLEPYRTEGLDGHPWADWAIAEQEAALAGRRLPGATSRWNRGKDLSWQPLRPELVCEVAFDHLQGERFRHAATFKRWRPDKPPDACRYDQLEETPPALLADLFAH